MTRLICILFIATSLHGLEREPAGYEQYLLPVYLQSARPGAFDSQWITEFTARNEGETPVQFFQEERAFFCDCPGMIGACAPGTLTQPHTQMRTSLQGDLNPANRGVFVYVSKNATTAFQLRVRDISRTSESWGTELPVVHSTDFRSSAIHLLDVPVRENYRQHLRIYGASSPSGTANVRARLYSSDGNDVLAERVLSLAPPHPDDRLQAESSRPARPAYAEITPLSSMLNAAGPETVRVEITPLTPGIRFWGFIAITNNETQHVTLVTPQ